VNVILYRTVYLQHHKIFATRHCVKKPEAVSLNRKTVQRRAADVSRDVETQLSEIFNKCVYNGHNLNRANVYICMWRNISV